MTPDDWAWVRRESRWFMWGMWITGFMTGIIFMSIVHR
jgi:hypothetical protein